MPDDLSEGYKIAQVERITGVGVHTLRAWERRYGVPEPDRSGGRQRMYSLADIELINRMRRLSAQGIPLARAAELARQEMAERGGRTVSDGLVARLFHALTTWDESAASSIWTDALETFDIQTTFDRVVVPLLKDVGNAWHDGALSVAQEHFASNFIRARLDLLSRQVTPIAGAPLVLLACMEGEHHELGLLMLAVMVRFSGLRTIYLGQDVPDDALVRTVEDAQPNVLAVHAGTNEGAQRLAPLLPRIRAAAPLTEVVYGGGGFDSDATAREVEGAAYGGANLGSAVLLINQLGRRARAGGKS